MTDLRSLNDLNDLIIVFINCDEDFGVYISSIRHCSGCDSGFLQSQHIAHLQVQSLFIQHWKI